MDMFVSKNFKTFIQEDKATDDKVTMLEARVKHKSDPEAFYKTLVPQSDIDRYFRLLDALRTYSGEAPLKEVEQFWKETESRTNSASLRHEVYFKYLIARLGGEQKDSSRKGLLKEFNQHYLGENLQVPNMIMSKGAQDVKIVTSAFNYDSRAELAKALEIASTSILKLKESDLHTELFRDLPHEVLFASCRNRSDADWYLQQILPQPQLSPQDFFKIVHSYAVTVKKFASSWELPDFLIIKSTASQLLALIPLLSPLPQNFLTNLLRKQFELDSTPKQLELGQIEAMQQFLAKLPEQCLNNPAVLETKSWLSLRKLFAGDRKPTLEDVLTHLNTQFQVMPIVGKSWIAQRYVQKHIEEFSTSECPFGGENSHETLEKVKQALVRGVREGGDRNKVEKIIDSAHLEKLLAEQNLLAGEQVESVAQLFTEIELNVLRDSRKLAFCKENPAQFDRDEPVRVSVELKNIRSLQISLFELNTANLHAGGKILDPAIDLSGLIPSEQQTVKYTQPPMHQHKETFEFPTVTKASRGLFVLELVGEGLCSRTIIKKGGLSLVPVSEHLAHEFVVLSEDGQPCPAAKLLANEELFVADEEGILRVPFSPKPLNLLGSLSLENFHEPISLAIPATTFALDFGTIYNEESLSSGATLDLLILPRLFRNNSPCSLSLLARPQLLLSSCSAEGLVSARHFDWEQGSEELAVQYTVPPKSIWVKVVLQGEVAKEGVTATKWLLGKEGQPAGGQSAERTVSVALGKETTGYVFRAKGVTGEGVEGLALKVEVGGYHCRGVKQVEVKTGEKGEVSLGSLNGVTKLKVSYADCGVTVSQEFPLESDNRFMGIPDRLDVGEGEDLRLPKLKAAQELKYFLFRTDASFSYLYADCTSDIEFEEHSLYCTKLKKGHYLFKAVYGQTVKTLNLNVISGRRWDKSPELIFEKNTAHRLQHQSNYLAIDPVTLNSKSKELSFKVYSNQIEAVKVNVLGFQDCPASIGSVLETLQNLTVRAPHTQYPIRQNGALYLSEREVGDELKYVVERQQRATFPGNNLEKPSGLLKQQFNRKTLADGQKTASDQYFKTSLGELPTAQTVTLPTMTRISEASQFKDQFLNNKWLSKRGTVVSSQPDLDGNTQINTNTLEGYGCWVILVQDGNNFIYQIFYPPRETVVKHEPVNLGLAQSRKAGSIYLHSRKSGVLEPGNQITLGERSNLSINSLHSFQQLFSLFLSFQPSLLTFSFMLSWASQSPETQAQLYQQYASNEMNLFLYLKDRKYFDTKVLAHIKSKLRPGLVDACIGGAGRVQDWLEQVYMDLPPWELALLARWCSQNNRAEDKARIVRILREREAVQKQKGEQENKKRFDSVVHFGFGRTGAQGPQEALTAGSGTLQAGGPKSYTSSKASESGMRYPSHSQQSVASKKNTVYVEVGQTYEYSEREYFLPLSKDYSDCSFGFWADMAEHFGKSSAAQALLSEKFIEGRSTSTLEVLMFCIFQGFLIPDEEEPAQELLELKVAGSQTIAKNLGQTPCLYFTKELIEKTAESSDPESSNVFVSYSYSPRIAQSREQTSNAKVNVFQSGVVYNCNIVVVSTSATPMDLELQAEVPAGSIPIRSENYFHSRVFTLNNYGNFSFEYSFYFPYDGEFTSFPPTLVSAGKLLKIGESHQGKTLKVLKVLPPAKIVSKECSLNELVSQIRTSKGEIINEAFQELKPSILQLLESGNLFDRDRTTLGLLAPACLIDREFFLNVLQALRNRGIFDQTLWSRSLYHDDKQSLKEYLAFRFPRNQLIALKDFELYYFQSELLSVSGFIPKSYDPLVNPRAHFVEGRCHSIFNKQFLDTYMYFLKYLQDKHDLDEVDKLQFAEYLIAQDRVKEASELVLGQTQTEKTTSIQKDYFTVYCLLSSHNPPIAKISEICAKYLDYPVISWRNKFVQAANIIYDLQNSVPCKTDSSADETGTSTAFKNARNALLQENLKAEISSNKIVIQSANINKLVLKFYKVDVETKFSIDPFSRKTDSTFGFVVPNLSIELPIKTEVGAKSDSVVFTGTEYEIPTEMANFNLCVQVSSSTKSLFLNYLPSSYQVIILQDKGLLQVLDKAGKPVSQAYVKIFSCSTTAVEKYHKDGYTDYLGCFDYITLNLEDHTLLKEYSVLILGPPSSAGSQILRIDKTASKLKAEKGSRVEDTLVEERIKHLQRDAAAKLLKAEITKDSALSHRKTHASSKYAVVFE